VSKLTRSIAALGAVFFASAGLAACGGGIPGDSVAKVGSMSITKATFGHWLNVAAASSSASTTTSKPVVPEPPAYTACIAHLKATSAATATKGTKTPSAATLKTECEAQYKSLSSEVLGFLISSNWVLGEASELGISVSDATVKKELEKTKDQEFPKNAEFEKFLQSSGQTVSDLLLRVKLNLLSSKIQAKVIKSKATVTKAQIEKYYRENKSKLGVQEKRNLKIILTKTEAQSLAAKKEIQGGTSFSTVAKKVSIDPTSKAKGGVVTGVVKGEEEQALEGPIFSAKTNVLTGPIKTPFGYYLFEVTGITPGKEESLAAAEATIKRQLSATQQQTALSKFVKEFKEKWQNKTECRSGYVVADCKGYKAPKGSTGAAATTTTG
jgi:foldase protein PrsA